MPEERVRAADSLHRIALDQKELGARWPEDYRASIQPPAQRPIVFFDNL
jgi:hypothetical protein